MKKLPIILASFCTVFSWYSTVQASDERGNGGVSVHSGYSNFAGQRQLFDFDDYEARMKAMDERGAQARKDIDELYAPLEGVRLNRPPENLVDEEMERVLAASLKTAEIEETQRRNKVARIEEVQRAVDEARGKMIDLNNKVGELTGIVEGKEKQEKDAYDVYYNLSKDDAEIEALESGDEKTRRLKERQEARDEAKSSWHTLYISCISSRGELTNLEEQEEIISNRYLALSQELEDLKK